MLEHTLRIAVISKAKKTLLQKLTRALVLQMKRKQRADLHRRRQAILTSSKNLAFVQTTTAARKLLSQATDKEQV